MVLANFFKMIHPRRWLDGVWKTMQLQKPAVAPSVVNTKYLPQGLFFLEPANETIDQLTKSISWTTPGVNGVTIRPGWNMIQPNDANDFDWSLVDTALALGQQFNKRVGILFLMGIENTIATPPWVYNTPGFTFFTSTSVVLTDTGNTVIGDSKVTALSNVFSAGYYVGAAISGPGIPANSYITSLLSSTSVGINSVITANGTNVPITVTDRYPAPWDVNYQALLANFVQAYAARYDTNPNIPYVSMAGYGKGHAMSFCQTTADNATLANTTYQSVTGNQNWINGFNEIVNIWTTYFKHTVLFAEWFGVQFSNVQTLNLQVAPAFLARGPGVGLKNNNLNPGDHVGGGGEGGPLWPVMAASSPTNPVGLQPQHAVPTDYAALIVAAKNIGAWFIEFYSGQLTSSQPAPITDNEYFINYVNGLKGITPFMPNP